MPDHIHLLLTPQEIALERAMQLIKGGFSHRLKVPSKFPVWQRGFTDHRIRDRQDFFQHRVYIRDNPVRSRLCQLPEDYPYSSAYHNLKQTSGAEAHEE
jgi:putative transposase